MALLDLFREWPAFAIASAGFVGLFIGSFLNVVILRLPPRLMHAWRTDARDALELDAASDDLAPPGLVVERSRCPKCAHQLAWWENVPVLSYVALRGRCRACRAPISWQYPAVELLTGVLSAAVVWRFGVTPQAGVALVATWFLVAGAGVDVRTTLLPDQLTLPLLWLALLAAALGPLFVPPATAIIGATVGYLSLWSVFWGFKLLTGKEGMGYGDFKLLAGLGAFTGWAGILPIVLMSSLVGLVVGGLSLVVRQRGRSTPIPFGPFLATAGWIQLVFGDRINTALYGALLP